MRTGNRDAKASLRARLEARQDREKQEARRRQEAIDREQAIRQSLARPPTTAETLIQKHLAGQRVDITAGRYADLLKVIATKAPRLIDNSWTEACSELGTLGWIRPLGAWNPKGKGRNTVTRSLFEHLLMKYPMPGFIWESFFKKDQHRLIPFIAHVAGGGSAYKAVQDGTLPMPQLSRKMCHESLTATKVPDLLHAIRQAQTKSFGGDERLFRTWMTTKAGRGIHRSTREAFWHSVLGWFCTTAMLSHAQVGPLVDYIEHRVTEDPKFVMKGRSPLALIRGMEEWHREMNQIRAVSRMSANVPKVFEKSGFQPLHLDKSRTAANGNHIKEIWRCREILTGAELLDEGRAMSHCVYSYAPAIASRRTSIWALTIEDDTGNWRSLTIEVMNESRQIVQARGRFNKAPEARAITALNNWAGKNNLTVSVGRW